MPQVDDLSRSLATFDQDATLTVVVEMSLSSLRWHEQLFPVFRIQGLSLAVAARNHRRSGPISSHDFGPDSVRL